MLGFIWSRIHHLSQKSCLCVCVVCVESMKEQWIKSIEEWTDSDFKLIAGKCGELANSTSSRQMSRPSLHKRSCKPIRAYQNSIIVSWDDSSRLTKISERLIFSSERSSRGSFVGRRSLCRDLEKLHVVCGVVQGDEDCKLQMFLARGWRHLRCCLKNFKEAKLLPDFRGPEPGDSVACW